MRKNFNTIALLIVLLSSIISCGKKKVKNDDGNDNPIVNCNLSNATLVANDTIYNIIHDTSYATQNTTFYTEHTIGIGHGCSIEFEGLVAPVEGTYTVTPIFNEVIAGSQKVYMQYYVNGFSYNGQGGTITVKGSGTSAIIEVCKVKFKESFGDEKTISLKSDSE